MYVGWGKGRSSQLGGIHVHILDARLAVPDADAVFSWATP